MEFIAQRVAGLIMSGQGFTQGESSYSAPSTNYSMVSYITTIVSSMSIRLEHFEREITQIVSNLYTRVSDLEREVRSMSLPTSRDLADPFTFQIFLLRQGGFVACSVWCLIVYLRYQCFMLWYSSWVYLSSAVHRESSESA